MTEPKRLPSGEELFRRINHNLATASSLAKEYGVSHQAVSQKVRAYMTTKLDEKHMPLNADERVACAALVGAVQMFIACQTSTGKASLADIAERAAAALGLKPGGA